MKILNKGKNFYEFLKSISLSSDNISKIAQKYEPKYDPNEKKQVNDLIGFWSKNKRKLGVTRAV